MENNIIKKWAGKPNGNGFPAHTVLYSGLTWGRSSLFSGRAAVFPAFITAAAASAAVPPVPPGISNRQHNTGCN